MKKVFMNLCELAIEDPDLLQIWSFSENKVNFEYHIVRTQSSDYNR